MVFLNTSFHRDWFPNGYHLGERTAHHLGVKESERGRGRFWRRGGTIHNSIGLNEFHESGLQGKTKNKGRKSHSSRSCFATMLETQLLAVAHLWPCKGTWIIWRWTSFLAECRRRCRLVGCQCITCKKSATWTTGKESTTWTLHYWCITLGSTAFDSKHGQLPLRLLSAMRAPGGSCCKMIGLGSFRFRQNFL